MAELKGRALIASRCAKFFKDGDFVNLGIGLPLMCVNYLPKGVDLWLEAEIGTVGSGPSPNWDDADIDIIDAGGNACFRNSGRKCLRSYNGLWIYSRRTY